MATGRTTKRSVDALTCPKGKDRDFLWDDTLQGFGCCVHATGRKIFVLRYFVHGTSRRVTIGAFGPVTVDQARDKAKVLLGEITNGADPLNERKQARDVPTFEKIAAEYIRLHATASCGTKTLGEYDGWLKRHILPAFGKKRINAITKKDLAEFKKAMANQPPTFNRCLSLFKAIWNYAAKNDLTALANPAQNLSKYSEEGRERYLTNDELSRLGDALRKAETEGFPYLVNEQNPKAKHAKKDGRVILDPFAVAAIRLLLLTGARKNEILKARWEWLDQERGILFLPTSKTGKKPVYLSNAALEILNALPRVGPYIIPGIDPKTARSDLNKPWGHIQKAAKLDGVRVHDLRHSFASVGAGGGMGLPIVGKLLGHSQASTTQRYAHLDADPVRAAAEKIGAKINAAMIGGAK